MIKKSNEDVESGDKRICVLLYRLICNVNEFKAYTFYILLQHVQIAVTPEVVFNGKKQSTLGLHARSPIALLSQLYWT